MVLAFSLVECPCNELSMRTARVMLAGDMVIAEEINIGEQKVNKSGNNRTKRQFEHWGKNVCRRASFIDDALFSLFVLLRGSLTHC